MLNYLTLFVYVGGMLPAYRHARTNGQGAVLASLSAIAWPADVGWVLAHKHCKTHKI